MGEYIMVGADVHDRSILLKLARGLAEPDKRSFRNDCAGRARMIRALQARAQDAGGATIVFGYEASGLGFGLYDELVAAGITCYVLAPSRIARSNKQKRQKTDERDAQQLFELVRGHTLAGNKLPTVWIPDPQTRDDREFVRARMDAGEKLTRIKTQIRCLIKRNQVPLPEDIGRGWTKPYLVWLWRLAQGTEAPELQVGYGARTALQSLLHQFESLQREIDELDDEIEALSRTQRYFKRVRELTKLRGVGLLAAMVFLTEIGDMRRFCNRRQIASFLGLVPSANESGEAGDRKGHITRQGPGRVRKVLCQAVWVRIGHDRTAAAEMRRITRGSAKRKKIAIVALMRRLGIVMWHRALEADETDTACRREGEPAEVAAPSTASRTRANAARGGPTASTAATQEGSKPRSARVARKRVSSLIPSSGRSGKRSGALRARPRVKAGAAAMANGGLA